MGQRAQAGGTAVTVLCWPGDNLMIHAAVEQCRPGDLLVVTTTSPCTDGLFGELFATALAHRGVRRAGHHDRRPRRRRPAGDGLPGLVGGGQRAGHASRRPPGRSTSRSWSAARSCGPATPCSPTTTAWSASRGERVGEALDAAGRGLEKEEATRSAFRDGELGLDRYGLRATLAELGVEYVNGRPRRSRTADGTACAAC